MNTHTHMHMDPELSSEALVEVRSSEFSFRTLIRWEFSYVLILLIWAMSQGNTVLKSFCDGFAMLMLLRVAVLLISRFGELDAASRVLMGATAFFASVNLLVNLGQEEIGEGIKILSIFLFFFAGTTVSDRFFDDMPKRIMVLLFVGLPVGTALFDLYAGPALGPLDEMSLSFFANRNNAILFSVVSSWALMLTGMRRSFIVFYLIGCALAFKTIGGLVAIAIALYLVYLGFNVVRVLVLGGFVALSSTLLDGSLEVLSRATSSWKSLHRVLDAAGGFWNISKMSYGEIYEAAQTSDISLIFRLKHWMNVLSLWTDGSALHQLFGFGVSQTLVLTDVKLLPHNDYLRFFFELGPGTFLCFVGMNLLILKRVGIRFVAIPIIFLFIYLFSDNIVNNFLVMSFFYFLAGAISSANALPSDEPLDEDDNHFDHPDY